MTRRPNKDTPTVQHGQLKAPSIAVGTAEWFAWLPTISRFYFECEAGSFTARSEKRQRGTGYWYAYRQFDGKLRSAYLGKTGQLTLERLTQIAAKLSQDAKRLHLEVGDLAILKEGYEAAWTNKRRKRRFDDDEMVVIADSEIQDGTTSYSIRKLDKPKIIGVALESQLLSAVEVIKRDLAAPLDLDTFPVDLKARLDKFKPSQRATLARAAYHLIQSGGAADLEEIRMEGRPWERAFPKRYPIYDLSSDKLLSNVREPDGTYRDRLTREGVLALRYLKATQSAYAEIGLRLLPRKSLKISLYLFIQGINAFVRGVKQVRQYIELGILSQYDMEAEDSHGNYILTIPYEDEAEVDEIIKEIFVEAAQEADWHNCMTEGYAHAEDGSDRWWD